ncbi:uncharacterized protein EV422DRAFT_533927 [Fimicolochytrium jonesii]|uniref:uncharacterized protein n=1 Tax=Fimicolochytrium jonesii TaxID=1396493 RepID=UPI0022FE9252|nr:uncharacterized protein EV422DRAFT_533927 [Fimicolochytrium jonesii]KAI8819687.1 hypothetical protein EV422DRAFT_533927 [Fimicolochytrium jonesii]
MSGSIDVEACAADPLVQGAVLSDPTVQAGITQKCMAQIGLVVQTATDRCTATVNDMSTTYGSTSILIGFTLPLIYLGLSVSIWRMWTKPSLRGGLLLFAMVLTVVDSGTLIAGK